MGLAGPAWRTPRPTPQMGTQAPGPWEDERLVSASLGPGLPALRQGPLCLSSQTTGLRDRGPADVFFSLTHGPSTRSKKTDDMKSPSNLLAFFQHIHTQVWATRRRGGA